LHLVIEQIPTTFMLMVLTCRPHFQPSWHHRSYLTEITVNRLSHAQVEQLVNRMTDGKTLPQEVLAQNVEKTDGGRPLLDELMERLDRLVTAKAVAQYAAVIGRQFAYDLLSTVSQLDEATLQRELKRLVDAELVYQRGLPPQSTYVFKHALIQDAAYASLLKS